MSNEAHIDIALQLLIAALTSASDLGALIQRARTEGWDDAAWGAEFARLRVIDDDKRALLQAAIEKARTA